MDAPLGAFRLITYLQPLFCFAVYVPKPAAFAAGDIGKSEDVTPGASSGNTNTGVVLTVVPVALAAGALTVSGIVLKKKNK